MTEIAKAQAVAVDRHCRLAGETIHPRYRHRGLGYTIVLTVNSGYE